MFPLRRVARRQVRHEGFYRDYMLVPLLVQQNYLPALIQSHDKATDKVDRMAYASEALSDLDLVDAVSEQRVWGSGCWLQL